jgi:hypothetical protein
MNIHGQTTGAFFAKRATYSTQEITPTSHRAPWRGLVSKAAAGACRGPVVVRCRPRVQSCCFSLFVRIYIHIGVWCGLVSSIPGLRLGADQVVCPRDPAFNFLSEWAMTRRPSQCQNRGLFFCPFPLPPPPLDGLQVCSCPSTVAVVAGHPSPCVDSCSPGEKRPVPFVVGGFCAIVCTVSAVFFCRKDWGMRFVSCSL